jgi:Kef-type K+ transport system membrane component KefB
MHFNFSIEIGALLAGFFLSFLPYRQEINFKSKTIKRLFLNIFFVYLGFHMTFGNIGQYILPIIILSLFILIGNPIIVLIIWGKWIYKKTGFMAGLTVAQISEFSLILIALGVTVGHINSDILSVVTIIGLITIIGSSYMIIYSEKIFCKDIFIFINL